MLKLLSDTHMSLQVVRPFSSTDLIPIEPSSEPNFVFMFRFFNISFQYTMFSIANERALSTN